MPDGTFNRWDSARYTPTQTSAILNSELAKLGCQAKIIGTSLYIVQAGAADAATAGPAVVPASAWMPASARCRSMQVRRARRPASWGGS